MAQDFSLPVRRAVLPRLKGDVGVTDLIPATQIHPGTVVANPVFPFIRYGAPIPSPFLASGLDSSSVRGTIHAFTKALQNEAGAVIDTAEDQAHRAAAAIAACIGGAVLPVDGGMKATITWIGTTILQDRTEAGAWHAVITFNADVAA